MARPLKCCSHRAQTRPRGTSLALPPPSVPCGSTLVRQCDVTVRRSCDGARARRAPPCIPKQPRGRPRSLGHSVTDPTPVESARPDQNPKPNHLDPPTHSLTHSLTPSLPHSLTYSLTHSLTHSLTQLTHSFAHALAHSLVQFETQVRPHRPVENRAPADEARTRTVSCGL